MKKIYDRTDLAYESVTDGKETEGLIQNNFSARGFEIHSVVIANEKASLQIQKPMGKYITVFTQNIRLLNDEKKEDLIDVISRLIFETVSELLPTSKIWSEDLTVLIAGLGNRALTADSLGPLTVEKITVTRNLKYSDPDLFKALSCACTSAIAPGVSAETGIEAADVIKGAVRASSPDVAILIDSLAARSCSRLASTVQISGTGIYPGSGIGNRRTPISKETLGIPVVSVGVPTVVDSSSLVYNVISDGGMENSVTEKVRQILENGRSFFVSHKDTDIIVEDFSYVIANAINRLCGLY